MKYLLTLLFTFGIILLSNAQAEFGFTSAHSVYFGAGSTTLTSKAKKDLDGWIERLKKGDVYEVVVFGYTDTNGKETLNYTLSQKRTEKVANYMIKKGIPEKFIFRKIPRGEDAPSKNASDDTQRTAEKSRQVEILITPKLDILDPAGSH